MHYTTQQTLNDCLYKLEAKRDAIADSLHRAQGRAKGWNPGQCVRLSEQLQAVETRINTVMELLEKGSL